MMASLASILSLCSPADCPIARMCSPSTVISPEGTSIVASTRRAPRKVKPIEPLLVELRWSTYTLSPYHKLSTSATPNRGSHHPRRGHDRGPLGDGARPLWWSVPRPLQSLPLAASRIVAVY